MMPIEYLSIIRRNYNAFIDGKKVSDDSLQRFFDGCFKDIALARPLPKMWICPDCLTHRPRELVLDSSYGHGDKPKLCGECARKVYQISTFQARASFSGTTFMYACYYLVTEQFDLKTTISGSETKLYDLEFANDVVAELKGSPRSVSNIDGSVSRLDRPGMKRTDTKKKAFDNSAEWRSYFPNGHFYILTNANPDRFRYFRSQTVSGIYNITKAKQLLKFVEEIRPLLGRQPLLHRP